MTTRKILITLILEIGSVAASLQVAGAADDDEAVARIQRLLVPTADETRGEADLRRISLLVTLEHAKDISAEDANRLANAVNAILDDEHVTVDLESTAAAATVAGKLRLTGCIQSLVRRITSPPPTTPQANPIRSTAVTFGTPVMAALVSIGEPAIPTLSKLAGRDNATEIERYAARRVLQQIEHQRVLMRSATGKTEDQNQ